MKNVPHSSDHVLQLVGRLDIARGLRLLLRLRGGRVVATAASEWQLLYIVAAYGGEATEFERFAMVIGGGTSWLRAPHSHLG